MKNIHLLPTDKPSRLHLIEDVLMFTNEYKNSVCDSEVNIYITSDIEIKEGDWYLNIEEKNGIKNPFYGKLYKANYSIKSVNTDYRHNLKKIILTTDAYLIKDGVQFIDDKFLKWFVKNPSCEFVKIVDDVECLPMPNIHIHKRIYKIIIPQETTLEKAAEIYANKKGDIPTTKLEDAIFKQGFIDGAKWQQEQQDCCTPVNQIKRYVDCVGCDKKPKEMSKKTAVDYLFNELIANPGNFIKAYKQAKEMEKEMTINAFKEGNLYHGWALKHEPEQYYNETYNKDK